ncbi:MAG TPA: AAA family ATPase [Neobacillus sp.]
MNQQSNQQAIDNNQIKKWEDELGENGKIVDEGSLIRSISNETNPLLLSKLLSLAALSRMERNQHDSLAKIWMEKAMKLDPENQRAKEYLLQSDWRKLKDIMTMLTFPSIRETDNRTAKKKTAEEYIQICQEFLVIAEEHLQELLVNVNMAAKMKNKDVFNRFQKLANLLTTAVETTVKLLKAANEYDQSITGVFHTSTYYDDVKSQLVLIDVIKADWQDVFTEQTEVSALPEDALEQLQKMVGMVQVKKRINDFYRFLKYQKQRKELGFRIKDELSLNMILTGNPGTGKTTLARLLAKIYHELGVLPHEEVIEVDRTQLIGAYVGQTEENVRSIVERAVGGVLFIDEAYSLKREGQSGNDYGQTAIDTLVSLMTGGEYGGRFAVIMAGYPEEMRSFIDANPGLRSRFPLSNLIHLPDYSNEELLLIAEKMASENDYVLTEEARMELEKRLERERVDNTFGNARTVRNIVLDAIFKKGSDKLVENDEILQFTLLNKEDFIVEKEIQHESPSEQFERLIGLDSIKAEMTSLISFIKMQQFRRINGLPIVPIQLHAVFTGNPGTGKTTVAKIYAAFLKECGILKRGHLIVASRADFVAGYLGQSAGKTKKKVREALGGMLFIDEAYSLLSQTNGDFGKEVIDTLVDEMTLHNENLVIVLAGYPKEMEMLLESNPGLRSRFKKFFLFPDYSQEDLVKIMDAYAWEYQYQITDDAKEYVKKAINVVETNGNGRFATNLVDEMIQAQAMRLMKEEEGENLVKKSLFLEEEDAQTALKKLLLYNE